MLKNIQYIFEGEIILFSEVSCENWWTQKCDIIVLEMMAVAIENTAESQLEDDWGSLCIVSEVAQVIKEEEGEEKIEVLFVGPYMHKPIRKNVVPEQTDME